MPWKETGPVLERTRFIEDYLSGLIAAEELTFVATVKDGPLLC